MLYFTLHEVAATLIDLCWPDLNCSDAISSCDSMAGVKFVVTLLDGSMVEWM